MLALLPFDSPQAGASYALVWSLPTERADELRGLDGPAFEEALLTALVDHHAEGIALAEAEVADGAFGPARGLAEDVVETQERETREMLALLEETAG